MTETSAPRSRRRLLVLAAALVAVVAVVVGLVQLRGEDDRGDDRAPATAEPPLLEPTWTNDDVAPTTSTLAPTVLAGLSGPDRVVVVDEGDLVALDGADGRELWRLPGGEPCQVSNLDGDQVAVTVRPAGARRCRQVALLDVATGEVGWRRPVPAATVRQYRQLGLSERVVTMADRCFDTSLFRFARATGRPLPDLVEDSFCEGAGLSSDLLVLPVEGSSGRTEALSMVDPDTGRRTGRVRDFDGPVGTDLVSILSRDPFVVDAVRGDHRVLRLLDERGRTVRLLGLQQDPNPTYRHELVGVADDVLVVAYGLTTYGIDLTTGDVLWAQDGLPDAQVIGLDGDRALYRYRDGSSWWLLAAPVRDGRRAEVLGRLPEGLAPAAVVDGRVVVSGEAGVGSVAVPADGDGVERSLALDAATRQARYVSGFVPEPGPDDYTAADDRGCDDVTPAAFRLLGWGDDAGLPRAAGCHWRHQHWDDGPAGYWFSGVEVSTTVVTGRLEQDLDGAATASEAAHDQLVEGTSRGAVRLPGVGDEAFVSRGRGLGSGRSAAVVVRDGNLLVRITVDASEDRGAPRQPRLDRALLVLMREVLTPYGIEAPTRLPRVPAGG